VDIWAGIRADIQADIQLFSVSSIRPVKSDIWLDTGYQKRPNYLAGYLASWISSASLIKSMQKFIREQLKQFNY
jgi:hypothetical protein